jgi:hypothetical protein
MNEISDFVVEDTSDPLERGSLVILTEPLAETSGEVEDDKGKGEECIEMIDLSRSTEPSAVLTDFIEISIETPRDGQPAVMQDKDEEERLYLRPAARTAYHVTRVETLREFKRVTGKDFDNQWECINKPSSPFVLLVSTHPSAYMIKARLPDNMPASRVIRMCIDFDSSTRLRWDHDLTFVRVVEEFPDDLMRVVQWKVRKPPLALMRYPPGGISVISWDYNARYVVATHIPTHRMVAGGATRDYSVVEGWSAFYITENSTLVAVFSLQCRDMPGYAAYYADMLEQRVSLMESVCNKWNYYYT